MTTRLFLLLERKQKLEARLRLAQSRRQANPLEIARLRAVERTLRDRLTWLMRAPALRSA